MLTTITRWLSNKVATTINTLLFEAFIRGLIPGFRISDFISKEEAATYARNIAELIEEYKTAPGVGRAGETLVEHPHDFDEYAIFNSVLSSKEGFVPEREILVNLVCGYLALATGYPFRVLHNGAVACFYGLFRKINSGAGVHVDIVSEDSDAFKGRNVLMQASLVLHLEVPEKGGETVLWDRRADSADKQHLKDDWQYDEAMLAEANSVTVPCVAGELVILSTQHYHKVNPILEESGNRISFSMFTVIFEDEPGVIYIYN